MSVIPCLGIDRVIEMETRLGVAKDQEEREGTVMI